MVEVKEKVEMVKQYEYEDGSSLNKDRIEEIGQEEWDKMSIDEKNDDLKQHYGLYQKGKETQEKFDAEREGAETDSLDLDWGDIFTFNMYN